MISLNRRHFLSGFAAAGIAGVTASAKAAAIRQPYETIGVQLYTVRAAFAADPLGTLRRIKALGYGSVESINFGGMTPLAFKGQLADIGLQMPSGHIGLDDWKTRPEAVLDDMAAAGADYALLAWLPEGERKDWKALAAQMNRWGALAKERDLGFAYHNHNFEFTPSSEGLPYHLLLDNTDPKLVAFELDCYWASLAGHDPVHVLKEHGRHFSFFYKQPYHRDDGAGRRGRDRFRRRTGSGQNRRCRICLCRTRQSGRSVGQSDDKPEEPARLIYLSAFFA